MDIKVRKPIKTSFKLKKDKNGCILNFHNTANDDGQIVRIRLINACFNYNNTQLITIDHRGNIFVIDMVIKKIWKMFDKCKRSTVVQNNFYSLNEYIIGTKDGKIVVIDIEKGCIKKSEKFCSYSIEVISIPMNSENLKYLSETSINSKYILIATSTEAILVDTTTFQTNFKLEFNTGNDNMNFCYKQTSLKFISYFPNSERIFACFTDDSVHIWSTLFPNKSKIATGTNSSTTDISDDGKDDENILNKTDNSAEIIKSVFNLKTIRIIYPLKTRDRQLKLNKSNEPNELKFTNEISDDSSRTTNNIFNFVNAAAMDDEIIDLSRGLINSFEFSLDGNYICLTTLDECIILMSSITLDIIKIIKLKGFCLKKCLCFEKNLYRAKEFNSDNKNSNVKLPTDLIAIALTLQSDIVLIDFNDLLVKTIILGGGATYKMNLSYNGKLLFAILKSGEISVFRTSIALNTLLTTQKNIETVKKIGKAVTTNENLILTKELKKTLSKSRLLPILKEYGSYSNRYRHLIWTNLLDLPSNKEHFTELLKKGLHPIVLKYDQEFPIKDVTLLRNLKKISSCLMYWSRILAECDFLPKFIFPFLKIFPNNSLLTFELLVTILYNHCQLWFEFIPMEPLNYLGLIENILHYFDPDLYKFYSDRNITTKIYAWPLLITCFSEVLDEQQWYQLWDNILTKDIDYIIFIVLSFQLIQRNIIMRLETNESIELFFHEQYIIDMEKLIKKGNNLMNICPNELHPRRYLKSFVSLPKGYYPKFENYPKEWIELKDKEMDAIRIENYILDEKIRNLEIEEIQLGKKLEEGLKDEETQRRLKELEKLYCGAISREEERIACQRKLVLMYQKETRNRRGKVLDMVRDSMNRKNINLHENQLDTLMRNIERTRLHDETDMMLADEDLKDRELNLLSQIYKIKSNSIVEYDISNKNNSEYHVDREKHYQDDDPNTKIMNANYIRNTFENDIFKSRSKDDNSRTIIPKKITSTSAGPIFKNNSRLAKEFKKRNNVIRKTYGVQLDPDSNNPVVIEDKKRTIANKKKKKNYIDCIEGMLDQIQMEFKNIVNPEIGSS